MITSFPCKVSIVMYCSAWLSWHSYCMRWKHFKLPPEATKEQCIATEVAAKAAAADWPDSLDEMAALLKE